MVPPPAAGPAVARSHKTPAVGERAGPGGLLIDPAPHAGKTTPFLHRLNNINATNQMPPHGSSLRLSKPQLRNRGLSRDNLSDQLSDVSAGLVTGSGIARVCCEALIRLSTRVRANCWAISIGIIRRQATVA